MIRECVSAGVDFDEGKSLCFGVDEGLSLLFSTAPHIARVAWRRSDSGGRTLSTWIGASTCRGPVRVALLGLSPWLGLRSGQLLDERVEAAGDLFDLPVDQAQALSSGFDMGAGGLGRTGRNGQRRPLQARQRIGRGTPPNAVRRQHRGDPFFGQATRIGQRRPLGPKRRHLTGADIVREVKGLRVVAPELLADAAGQPATLALELLGHARPTRTAPRRSGPTPPSAGSSRGRCAGKTPARERRAGRPWPRPARSGR